MFSAGAYQSAGIAPYALVVSDTVCEVFILLPSNQPIGNRKRAPETRALGGLEHEFAKRLSEAEALHCCGSYLLMLQLTELCIVLRYVKCHWLFVGVFDYFSVYSSRWSWNRIDQC